MATQEDKEFYTRMWQQNQMLNNGCGTPIYIAVIVFVVMFLSSCATRTKIEYRDRDVNHYITNTIHDTLRIKETDSVHHEIITRNDTVFDTKYVEKTRWHDRIVEKHDTCWRDSVTTEYKEKVSEVVKYPKTYWWLLGISIFSFIFAFVKLMIWLRIKI